MPCIERRRPPISRILFYLSVNSLRLALEPVGFVLSSLRDAFQSCSPRLFLILGITSCFIDIFIYLEHQHLESIFKSHLSDLLSFRLISSFQQNCSTDFGWLCKCCIFRKRLCKTLSNSLELPNISWRPYRMDFSWYAHAMSDNTIQALLHYSHCSIQYRFRSFSDTIRNIIDDALLRVRSPWTGLRHWDMLMQTHRLL